MFRSYNLFSLRYRNLNFQHLVPLPSTITTLECLDNLSRPDTRQYKYRITLKLGNSCPSLSVWHLVLPLPHTCGLWMSPFQYRITVSLSLAFKRFFTDYIYLLMIHKIWTYRRFVSFIVLSFFGWTVKLDTDFISIRTVIRSSNTSSFCLYGLDDENMAAEIRRIFRYF